MKTADLKNQMQDRFGDRSAFICRCFTSAYDAAIEKAASLDEFLSIIKNDDGLRYRQATGLLLSDDWYFLRSLLGNKCKHVISDAGGIKIGTDDFSLLIPNGKGDGVTRYAVLEASDPFNSDAFHYFTSIKVYKEMKIYSSDCVSSVLKEGTYSIYFNEGIVVFLRRESDSSRLTKAVLQPL